MSTIESGAQNEDYYYMATVQKPSSITKCIKCNFTSTMGQIEDIEMRDEQIDSSRPVESNLVQKGKYINQSNLVMAQSDSLRIFTVTEEGTNIQLRQEFSLNDQVLDILAIPTKQFKQQPPKKSLGARKKVDMS